MDKKKLNSIVKEAIENVIGSESQVDGLDGLLETAQEISSYALVLYNNAKLIPKAYEEIRSNIESLGFSVESTEYTVGSAYYQLSDEILQFAAKLNAESGYFSEGDNTPSNRTFFDILEEDYSDRLISGSAVSALSDSVFDGWKGYFMMSGNKAWFMFEGSGGYEYDKETQNVLEALKDLGVRK